MVYGIILAGGIGRRMGNDKPKQFLMVGEKPIIIHTIEKFCVFPDFQKVIVLCPEQWVAYTKSLVKKYIGNNDKLVVIEGGATRNETIMNSIRYIEETDGMDEDTIIVTHDSVRPFVTHRILRDNVEAALKYGACDTVIPATDTIITSEDGKTVSEIPNRSHMYQGQTPQTFQAAKLKAYYESLTDAEKDILTDAAKIFVMKGEPVYLVNGEVFNIKITYPYDLRVAEALIAEKN
ncbi:MAG: 2-C-methyl-D-erythritol 4-phosphate cytidylyltransferase [Clostridiales bacterium]|nr:2-C-methyl-D-erythritol 4-phosphate cytidylyltransferase [Clostridiales bacterium]